MLLVGMANNPAGILRRLKVGNPVRYRGIDNISWTYGRVSFVMGDVVDIHDVLGPSRTPTSQCIVRYRLERGEILLERASEDDLAGKKISYEDD